MAELPPSVIGASYSELKRLVVSDDADAHAVASTAVQLIDALFEQLLAAAEAESSFFQLQPSRDSATKRNRRAKYLEPSQRVVWRNRSIMFLERCWSQLHSMPIEAIYIALAMQHYLDLDNIDMKLPSGTRCSSDFYTDGLNNQFLLDASRARFTINGQVFHFAEASQCEAEAAFVARLVAALRDAVPSKLLGCVTLVMSQSGLAALERASLCLVAVSGGMQLVDYKLQSLPMQPSCIMVSVQMLRKGFREYLLIDPSSQESINDIPHRSDAESLLQKGATISFGPEGDVDVVEIHEQVEIYWKGRLLPSKTFFKEVPHASSPIHRQSSTRKSEPVSTGYGCARIRRFCRRIVQLIRRSS